MLLRALFILTLFSWFQFAYGHIPHFKSGLVRNIGDPDISKIYFEKSGETTYKFTCKASEHVYWEVGTPYNKNTPTVTQSISPAGLSTTIKQGVGPFKWYREAFTVVALGITHRYGSYECSVDTAFEVKVHSNHPYFFAVGEEEKGFNWAAMMVYYQKVGSWAGRMCSNTIPFAVIVLVIVLDCSINMTFKSGTSVAKDRVHYLIGFVWVIFLVLDILAFAMMMWPHGEHDAVGSAPGPEHHSDGDGVTTAWIIFWARIILNVLGIVSLILHVRKKWGLAVLVNLLPAVGALLLNVGGGIFPLLLQIYYFVEWIRYGDKKINCSFSCKKKSSYSPDGFAFYSPVSMY